jgi:hypothetical protein
VEHWFRDLKAEQQQQVVTFPVTAVNILRVYGKKKVKFTIEQATGPQGAYRYIFTLSLTSALDGLTLLDPSGPAWPVMGVLYLLPLLDGGGWSTPRPGHFTIARETQCPLYRRLGGSQSRSGGVRKTSPLPGFDPRTALNYILFWLTLKVKLMTLRLAIPVLTSYRGVEVYLRLFLTPALHEGKCELYAQPYILCVGLRGMDDFLVMKHSHVVPAPLT